MLVTWKQIERELQRSKKLKSLMQLCNAQICPACRELYEPCVEVVAIGHNIWHLVPVSVHSGFAFGYSYEFIDYVFPFCAVGEQVRIREGILSRIARSKCAEQRFLWMLVRRYPQLLGSPLTASVLQKAGCDIEAEWALWQLGSR
jgi:hypothetical protein